MTTLEAELQRRHLRGQSPRTLSWIKSELNKIGYRLGDDPCRCNARWDNGSSYPCDTRQVFEADSGLTFCNTGARRDESFKRLQEIRFSGEWFAVVCGHIVEI